MELQGEYFELISSNRTAEELDAATVFGDVDNLAIVYQDDGSIYIPPPLNVNTIGDIAVTEGYQIFCSENSSLTIVGDPLDPATEFSLEAGRWTWLGYPFTDPVPVETALSEITDQVVIIMNDDGGIWIPDVGVNTIETMNPGEGFYAFVNEGVTFQYTAGEGFVAAAGNAMRDQSSTTAVSDFPEIVKTGLPGAVLVSIDEPSVDGPFSISSACDDVAGLKAKPTSSFRQINSSGQVYSSNAASHSESNGWGFSKTPTSSYVDAPAIIEIYDGELLVGRATMAEGDVTPVICWQGSEEHGLPGLKCQTAPAHRCVFVGIYLLIISPIPLPAESAPGKSTWHTQ